MADSWKDIVFSAEARDSMMRGVEILNRAVAVTLGPKGRNVLLTKSFSMGLRVTKDGVTVAKEVELENKFENMGARLVRDVAMRTNDVAGDGTTTATVIAHCIAREGIKAVAAGMNPIDLQRGVDAATKAVATELKKQSRTIGKRDEIARVATVAANNDTDVGEWIAEAMTTVGTDGLVSVDEGKSLTTEIKLTEGMKWDRGYLSSHFVTDPKQMVCEYNDALVLCFEAKVDSIPALVPLLELVIKAKKPLLIVAEDVEGEALATLVTNKVQGGLKCVAVKGPGFGDRRKESLRDMAILAGAHYVSADAGEKLENVTLDMLGRVDKVIVRKDDCAIIGGKGKKAAVEKRCEEIRKTMEVTKASYDYEKLNERLARLSSGVAVINVGGTTEAEVRERKDRVNDSLNATRAAIAEGVVSGGGLALLRARKVLDKIKLPNADQRVGANIVREALQEPVRQIAENAGQHGWVVVQKCLDAKNPAIGFNAETGTYEDLFKAGIIDPTKVVRCALEDAASVAARVLTTEALITESPDVPKEPPAAPPMGRGPGAGPPPGMGGMGGMGGGMGGMPGMGGMGGMGMM